MLLVSLAEKILKKKKKNYLPQKLSRPPRGPSQKFFHFVQPVGFSSWGKSSPALFFCFPDFSACFSACRLSLLLSMSPSSSAMQAFICHVALVDIHVELSCFLKDKLLLFLLSVFFLLTADESSVLPVWYFSLRL